MRLPSVPSVSTFNYDPRHYHQRRVNVIFIREFILLLEHANHEYIAWVNPGWRLGTTITQTYIWVGSDGWLVEGLLVSPKARQALVGRVPDCSHGGPSRLFRLHYSIYCGEDCKHLGETHFVSRA